MHDSFNKYFKWFDFNFQIAMKCLQSQEYREHYAARTGYDPKGIMSAAVNWSKNMRNRKTYLYNHPMKIEAAKELIDTLMFLQLLSQKVLNLLTSLQKPAMGLCLTSKIGKYRKIKSIEEFNDKRSDIKVISTARALDEGFDIQDVTLAIVCSGTLQVDKIYSVQVELYDLRQVRLV